MIEEPIFRTIEAEVFYNRDREPVCSKSMQDKQECRFLGFTNFGLQPVCMLGARVNLNRKPEGTGFIRPHSKCELHHD